jgi:hypothetical protein
MTEREPYVGLADVVDDIEHDDLQTSPGGQTHQVRGEWGMRRGSDPAYTITGTQYPTVIDGDFEPDPDLNGVGDVDCSRTMTREEVRIAQTIEEIEVETTRKTEALTYIGNAVPADLAESVVAELPFSE